ncbi:T9SS type A sorting domain-containing protein [Hymenobacter psychrotolerans]|uniref:Por secretion system C-terminal sorting domain-containing protein n=1 Tax=Hymenobacter psychrotolerans DSM 18569 TaxID=1121959 RepID=A0A1M6PZ92_9BACT|nr:T9SS type A sorting domain-containing protein [Hymenobacter psychrotolerans]SHK13270.1 Por secretion system C-terminal sorting domain-containing protein [Hymenobacter psychrotolerans DSM 18569]
MKTLFTLVCLAGALSLSASVQAQTKPVAKPAAKSPAASAPAAKPKNPAPATTTPAAPSSATPAPAKATAAAEAPAPPALVTDKMEQPASNTGALKVRAETNPVTKRLSVRTDATGPTRVEINGPDGRPVITRDLINSSEVAVLDVSGLPAGAYIVQCTSGERRGMKRVMVGQ